jgi:hypothetical protein
MRVTIAPMIGAHSTEPEARRVDIEGEGFRFAITENEYGCICVKAIDEGHSITTHRIAAGAINVVEWRE